MPPKQLSKKELMAMKKQRREMKKEEARRAAEERRRLEEEERARLEEERRLAREAEEARLKAEHDRIVVERQSLEPFFSWRSSFLDGLYSEAEAEAAWKRYIKPSALPFPADESQMNNFFNVMNASYDNSFNSVLSTIIDIFMVFSSAEQLAWKAHEKRNYQLATKYRDYMKKLEELAQKRVDITTAHLLEKSHEIWKQSNESTFCAANEGWKLALWVNHAKNPRLQVLDLPIICTTIDLPKSFSFANVAIRLQHQVVDPLLKSKNQYMSLGGVFIIDVLAVPPPPVIVKDWTFEFVTTMTSNVVHLGYPISVVGSGATLVGGSLPPIGVEFLVPGFVFQLTNIPEIGWWDEELECWKKDNIIGINYDSDTRKLRFQTTKAKPHALLQSRVGHFPYLSWTLNPLSEFGGLLTLVTSLMTIKIEIGSGWCKLIEPQSPEFVHLQNQKMEPSILLKQLSRSGIHLVADIEDCQHVDTSVKVEEVERYCYHDTALTAPGFAIASSKWNAFAESHSCVIRLLEIIEPQFPPNLEKSKNVKLFIYKEKGNAVLNLTEHRSKEFREDLLTEYHASVLVTLRGLCDEESIAKLERGDPAYTECVKDLFSALKLLSFGRPKPVQRASVPQVGENKSAEPNEQAAGDETQTQAQVIANENSSGDAGGILASDNYAKS